MASQRVTGKHRFEVQSRLPLTEVTFTQLLSELEPSLPGELRSILIRNPLPVVLVEYCREHFISWDRQIRLTIDYDLAFYNQCGKSTFSATFPQRLPEVVVLEGKAPLGTEGRLRDLLFPLQVRAARFSKYVHGCDALGLCVAPQELKGSKKERLNQKTRKLCEVTCPRSVFDNSYPSKNCPKPVYRSPIAAGVFDETPCPWISCDLDPRRSPVLAGS